MLRRYLQNSWLVLALSCLFGSALAGMHLAVSGRIAENKLNETLSQIPALVPGATGGAPADLPGCTAFRATKDGKLIGWVVPAAGQGFADSVELLLGLDAAANQITGLYVLDQKETPGLGNRIVEDKWRAQFVGKSATTPLSAVKRPPKDNEIQAVTGATISSVAVCDIANSTLKKVHDELAAAAKGANLWLS